MENEEPQLTIKLAAAKAEIQELIEQHDINIKEAVVGGKKPDIKSFSSEIIDDLIEPEFSREAETWWKLTGQLLWKTELTKRTHLYFDPWAIGFLAGWIGTYISFMFFPSHLVTFPGGLALAVGAIYGISIRSQAINRLFVGLRIEFLNAQVVWKAKRISKKYPEIKFENLEDIANISVTRN